MEEESEQNGFEIFSEFNETCWAQDPSSEGSMRVEEGKLRKLGDSPRPCCLQVEGILLSSKVAQFLKDFGAKYSDLLYQNG